MKHLERAKILQDILDEELSALKSDMQKDIGRHARVKVPRCYGETYVIIIRDVQWTHEHKPAYSVETIDGVKVRPLYPEEVEFLDETLFEVLDEIFHASTE
jgi:hypothetical protein